jgi:hypothetical protein
MNLANRQIDLPGTAAGRAAALDECAPRRSAAQRLGKARRGQHHAEFRIAYEKDELLRAECASEPRRRRRPRLAS